MSKNDTKSCLNCGTPLTDAFCPHCGQKASVARLTVKTAIIDNFWNMLRMDSKVLPTAYALVTRPWVVIRDYIHGHRIAFTQPVRLIVILCFVNIILQMFIPDIANDTAVDGNEPIAEEFAMRIWHSVQEFLRDSEVATDMLDSVIFVPIVWLIYLPWGSRRFNIAEYSTAYLYICATELIMDLVTLPIRLWSKEASFTIQFVWGIYLFNGLVKHSFHIKKRLTRIFIMIINVILITVIGGLTHYYVYGDNQIL